MIPLGHIQSLRLHLKIITSLNKRSKKPSNEFINQEVFLTVLKGKIELTLSNKPATSKITLQRVSNNCYSTTDGNITINLELEKQNFVQTQYRLIEYGGTDDKFFSLHMTLDKQ